MSEVFTLIFATYTNILTSINSTMTHVFGFNAYGTLLYHPLNKLRRFLASVSYLSPVEFSAQDHLTSELLRFL